MEQLKTETRPLKIVFAGTNAESGKSAIIQRYTDD
mgnify:CR=1 FL=1